MTDGVLPFTLCRGAGQGHSPSAVFDKSSRQGSRFFDAAAKDKAFDAVRITAVEVGIIENMPHPFFTGQGRKITVVIEDLAIDRDFADTMIMEGHQHIFG